MGIPSVRYKTNMDFVPYYSTDIAAAWEVVDKMIIRTPYECYLEHQTHGWMCTFRHPGVIGGYAHEKTAPEAICRAALKAIGIHETI